MKALNIDITSQNNIIPRHRLIVHILPFLQSTSRSYSNFPSKVKEIEDQLIPIERSIETFKSHLPKVDSKISRATEEYNEEEKNVKIIENEMSEDMKKYTSLESDQASLKQLSLAKKREVEY